LADVPNGQLVPSTKIVINHSLDWTADYLFVLEHAILLLKLLELVLKMEIFLLVALEVVHIALQLLDDDILLVGFDAQGSVVLR